MCPLAMCRAAPPQRDRPALRTGTYPQSNRGLSLTFNFVMPLAFQHKIRMIHLLLDSKFNREYAINPSEREGVSNPSRRAYLQSNRYTPWRNIHTFRL